MIDEEENLPIEGEVSAEDLWDTLADAMRENTTSGPEELYALVNDVQEEASVQLLERFVMALTGKSIEELIDAAASHG